MISPNVSWSVFPLGAGATDAGAGAALGARSDAASGFGSSFCCFPSREPIWSFVLYFSRIPLLWYFQNCCVASLPPTLWRTRESFWCDVSKGKKQKKKKENPPRFPIAEPREN